MKKALVLVASLALATFAFAGEKYPELNTSKKPIKMRTKNYARPGGGGANLTYHTGGKVVRNAKVVLIFWGAAFGSGSGATYASQIQNFRNSFGSTGEYNTITQYSGVDNETGATGNIAGANLGGGTADWFDSSNPSSTNVTDAMVQAEVKKYLTTHTVNYSTIYEVFLPSGYFSSDGNQGSCGATGGVSLAYCAYHSHYSNGTKNVLYSIEPYPSCSGCSVSGWTDAQNQEHFVCHETREAVTDALGNAWFDRQGYEADDKCAWSPSPFVGTGGFGYQYEWSNANSGCVKTR